MSGICLVIVISVSINLTFVVFLISVYCYYFLIPCMYTRLYDISFQLLVSLVLLLMLRYCLLVSVYTNEFYITIYMKLKY